MTSEGEHKTDARWIFDRLPPSGSRRGGDPAKHVFKRDVETFVREVIQNANDQGFGTVEVRLRWIELSGDRLQEFQTQIDWPSLSEHLRGSFETPRGAQIKEFVQSVELEKKLILLRVEDRYTRGLTGAESEDQSHFTALCKDTLYSHKLGTGAAGGSYGLGKSVLWSFSGLSTVLFCSNPTENPEDFSSPRLIGRTELPSHQCGDVWFTGAGWFGKPMARDGGERAESVWGEEARDLADRLEIARDDSNGTTILIVGFSEPATEESPDEQKMLQGLRSGVNKNFWPALIREESPLVVGIENQDELELFDPRNEIAVAPFVECYRKRDSELVIAQDPGDISTKIIDFEIPARRDGSHKKILVSATLVVRLATHSDDQSRRGHVALVRGPGMVVKYVNRSNVAIGARPFHGLLLCGKARGLEHDLTDADKHLDRFLRDSEPPGHDDWISTEALKQNYEKGYAKALKEMESRVAEAIKEIVAPAPVQGDKGPDLLRKRFPLQHAEAAPGAKRGGSAFHFKKLEATRSGGRWRFLGKFGPAEPSEGGWTATIEANALAEDGKAAGRVMLATLSAKASSGEDVQVAIAKGNAVVTVSTNTNWVSFEASSDENGGKIGSEVELCVRATMGPAQQ